MLVNLVDSGSKLLLYLTRLFFFLLRDGSAVAVIIW